MAVCEELPAFTENNYDVFSLLASGFSHRHMGMAQKTTPHLSTSAADVKVIIRSYRITVLCVKCKENSYLVYLTSKITTSRFIGRGTASFHFPYSLDQLWLSIKRTC